MRRPDISSLVQIYLPIAELSVNMFIIFGMGGAVGFLSGMFGIGGGFLLTPLLIFSGIPPVVSVATVAAQIVASSSSAALTYWRRRMVDMKLAGILLSAGVVGSAAGVFVFSALRRLGQLELVVSLSYVSLLSLVGGLMLTEAVRAIINARRGRPAQLRRPGQHNWIHGLPFKVRFRRSKLYISLIPVVVLGLITGFLGALLGIGGGFIAVPAMIYLLRVPTNVVIGTSLVQIVATMSVAAVLHAFTNQSVDLVLALILMVGGVMGAQFGARAGQTIRGDQLRALLALLVLGVGGTLSGWPGGDTGRTLFIEPAAGKPAVKPSWRIAVLLLASAIAASAEAEELTIALSTQKVEITSNFAGGEVTLFGVIEPGVFQPRRPRGYDIAVTLLGPPENVVVRRKDRVLGVWDQPCLQTCRGAQFLCASFVSADSGDRRARHPERVGAGSRQFPLCLPGQGDRQGPVGGRVPNGLSQAEVRGGPVHRGARCRLHRRVDFSNDNFAPGQHTGGALHGDGLHLFSGGAHLADAQESLSVARIGAERLMFDFSRNQSLIYGLIAVGLALFVGWLGGVIFRRD